MHPPATFTTLDVGFGFGFPLAFPGAFALGGGLGADSTAETVGSTVSCLSCVVSDLGEQANGTADHSPHCSHCSVVCPFKMT
jgi:hypothetical protein